MQNASLTIVNTYKLKGSADDFVQAITRLAARVEAEGDKGVLSYRFFVNATGGTARAIVDYANAAAWIGHHDIAMPWDEMKALHTVASLDAVVFLGSFTAEIENWLKDSSLKAHVSQGNEFAAGFVRTDN